MTEAVPSIRGADSPAPIPTGAERGRPSRGPAGPGGAFLVAVRPRQWVKNLLVLAPAVFAQKALSPPHLSRAAIAAAAFTLLSAAVYLFNDLVDRDRDRAHPVKRLRPIARGALSASAATWAIVPLACGGLLLAQALGRGPALACAAYLALQGAYGAGLKRMPILDLFVVAAGFVLRVVLGAVAIDVPISNWLYLCTLLLALFLGLSKRRAELTLLESDAAAHRENLAAYTPALLDQMIAVVTASTLIAYAMYTVSEETVRKFGTDTLKFTVPFVLYGIFRYLYLVHRKKEGGSPERVLFADAPLLVDVALYVGVVAWVLYARS